MNYICISQYYACTPISLLCGVKPSSNKVLNNEILDMSHPSLVHTKSNCRRHQCFLISNRKKKEESK